MRTYRHLRKRVQVFFNGPPKSSTAGSYLFVENIEIWVRKTTFTKYAYMHIKHLKTSMKGIISLENIISHLKDVNAHTREYIQDKDYNNIKHVNNQR